MDVKICIFLGLLSVNFISASVTPVDNTTQCPDGWEKTSNGYPPSWFGIGQSHYRKQTINQCKVWAEGHGQYNSGVAKIQSFMYKPYHYSENSMCELYSTAVYAMDSSVGACNGACITCVRTNRVDGTHPIWAVDIKT